MFAGITLLGKPTLRLLKPNGGEKFIAGHTITLNWDYRESSDQYKDVVIILYKDGIKLKIIAESAPNSGTFSWNIPADIPVSCNYRVRIRLKKDLSINDFSDGNFSIFSN